MEAIIEGESELHWVCADGSRLTAIHEDANRGVNSDFRNRASTLRIGCNPMAISARIGQHLPIIRDGVARQTEDPCWILRVIRYDVIEVIQCRRTTATATAAATNAESRYKLLGPDTEHRLDAVYRGVEVVRNNRNIFRRVVLVFSIMPVNREQPGEEKAPDYSEAEKIISEMKGEN